MTSDLKKVLVVLFCYQSLFFTALHGQSLTARRTAEGFEISEGGTKVLFYQTQPKSLNGQYERANYIHPLYSLNGNILTEDFPEDHPHHRGIFWAWHQIILDDKHIADGWSCENISWDVADVKIKEKRKKLVLSADVSWKILLAGKIAGPIVKENTNITVHRSTGQHRIIDFDITLFPLVDLLKIGGSDDEKGYSGFSLRLKLPNDIAFFSNVTEIIPHELGIHAGPWMDFTGSFEGANSGKSGVAVFCHPSNPGFPQPWILRKEKSMQNPAYPGRMPVDLTKKGCRLRYRLVIHRDNLNNDDLKKLFDQYK